MLTYIEISEGEYKFIYGEDEAIVETDDPELLHINILRDWRPMFESLQSFLESDEATQERGTIEDLPSASEVPRRFRI